jgi:hypothetical protein
MGSQLDPLPLSRVGSRERASKSQLSATWLCGTLKWVSPCDLGARHASHNFIIRESAERMELHLEELKAPIEVHFTDGIPNPTTLQAKEVPL